MQSNNRFDPRFYVPEPVVTTPSSIVSPQTLFIITVTPPDNLERPFVQTVPIVPRETVIYCVSGTVSVGPQGNSTFPLANPPPTGQLSNWLFKDTDINQFYYSFGSGAIVKMMYYGAPTLTAQDIAKHMESHITEEQQ